MPLWFFVKFLWEVQSLDNSATQKFCKEEASCSRDIQVRRKSILVFNNFYVIPWLITIACIVL